MTNGRRTEGSGGVRRSGAETWRRRVRAAATAACLAAAWTASATTQGDQVRRQLASISQANPTADVVRFLEQATCGPTNALIAHVQAVGLPAYLDEQFGSSVSSYPNLPPMPVSSKDG